MKKYILLTAAIALISAMNSTSYAVQTTQDLTSQTSQVTTAQTSQATTSQSQTSQDTTAQTSQVTTAQTSQVTTAQTSQTTTSQSQTSQSTTAQTSQTTTSQTSQTTETPVFTDVVGHWAATYVNQLQSLGVVSGRTATTYAPDETLTRAEMVKIALLSFGYTVTDGQLPGFSDVSAGSWYGKYIAAAEAAGIVGGYSDNTFRPDAEVTRGEALKILLLAAKVTNAQMEAAPAATSFIDVVQSEWYATYVNYAYDKAVVSGKDATHFAPADNVTRGEMSKMAVKAMEM